MDAKSNVFDRRGFTYVELLVVIGILVILIAILLPTLSHTREASRRMTCLSNLRQLTMAWIGYAEANNGNLVSADTISPSTWVNAGDGVSTLKTGALYPYVGATGVYLCPNAVDRVPYSRSYSMNAYLNGGSTTGTTWYGGNGETPVQSLSAILFPDKTFVFIDEYDPRGSNQNGFALRPYPETAWVDHPAPWHQGAGMLSFADGHAQVWPWGDSRTSNIPATSYSSPWANQPGNADLLQLQKWIGFTPAAAGFVQ